MTPNPAASTPNLPGLTDRQVVQLLGGRLKTLRLQQNLLVADLSVRTGLNRNTIMNAERGANPRIETLVRLLRALGRLDASGFIPEPLLSPMALVRDKGKLRRRASRRQ